jgi:hypothetical protein
MAPDSTGSDQFWFEGAKVEFNGRTHIVTGMGGFVHLRLWVIPAGPGICEKVRMVKPSQVTKL